MPGEEGIGKSTVMMRVIADITRGTLPGEYLGKPRHVVVMATEDGVDEVVIPRLVQAGADLERVHIVVERTAEDGTGELVVLPRDLDLLDDLVAKHDVAMVYVDALAMTLPAELKGISYKDVSQVLGAVGKWAQKHRVAIVCPWHMNKGTSGDTALRIMDSRAFRTAVRSMLLIVRDPDAPEGQTHGIVALDKSNAGSLHVPALRYRLRSAPYVVEETDEDTGEVCEIGTSCGVADWIGELDGDGRDYARELLGSGGIETSDDAKSWLKKYLGDKGPTPRPEVIGDGKEAGYSESAVKRAATALTVYSEQKTGQDPKTGAPRKWSIWSLEKPGSSQSGQAGA